MFKGYLLIVALLVVASNADHLLKAREILSNDKCVSGSMKIIQPVIQKQMKVLKQDKNNKEAKDILMAQVKKVGNIYAACQVQKKVQPVLKDKVQNTGIAFLLASNCFKDVGIVLLLADTIVQDPKDWTNDIVVSIFLALLSNQGYADCQQFVNFIR